MIAYKKERLDNAIAFFAKRHRELAKGQAFKTYIFKYIALFDFTVLRETGIPAFDIPYAALKNGPIPADLYDNIDIVESDRFEVEGTMDDRHVFSETTDPDLDYFSDWEIDLLESIATRYMRPGMTTKVVIDATHDEIRAWQVAWESRADRGRVPMQYDDEFDSIIEKDDDALTPQEEAFIIHRGLEIARKSKSRHSFQMAGFPTPR